MKLVLAIFIALGFALGSGVSASASSTQESRETKLHLVRQIYVSDMGRTDEARRFRLLLQEQLIEKGFVVVDKAEDADAILTGALSVRIDDGSQARVYVRLETKNGERLWAKDFGNGLFKSLFTLKEPVKLRAEEVAKALRDESKKAARK